MDEIFEIYKYDVDSDDNNHLKIEDFFNYDY